MIIAVSILLVTALLAAMIGLRYLSPVFRERMEQPKYRFQANLGTKEKKNVEH
jgi:hypothetical protein